MPQAAGGYPAQASPAAVASQSQRRFPTAAEIPSGMERNRLEAAFGPPTMRTVAVEQGVPIETFVYLRREPDTATFVLIRSGRVVSVSTTAY
jgi:hypothetical protein